MREGAGSPHRKKERHATGSAPGAQGGAHFSGLRSSGASGPRASAEMAASTLRASTTPSSRLGLAPSTSAP